MWDLTYKSNRCSIGLGTTMPQCLHSLRALRGQVFCPLCFGEEKASRLDQLPLHLSPKEMPDTGSHRNPAHDDRSLRRVPASSLPHETFEMTASLPKCVGAFATEHFQTSSRELRSLHGTASRLRRER
jgi:hypothetical protein